MIDGLSVVILARKDNEPYLPLVLKNITWLLGNDKHVPILPFQLIINKDPITDFSAKRNELAEDAEYDWIWMPDADEVVLSRAMFRLMLENPEPHMVKMFPRYNYFYDYKHIRIDSGCYPDSQMRFYHRNYYRWHGKVHESLGSYREHRGLPVIDEVNVVLISHFGWLKPPEFQIAKHERFHELRGDTTQWVFPKLSEIILKPVPDVKELIKQKMGCDLDHILLS